MKHTGYSNIVLVCVYVCVCVLTSCRPDTVCRDEMTVGMVCEFKHFYLEGDQVQTSSFWSKITVQGIGAAEPLYNASEWVNKLYLPMRTNGDSTRYTMLYQDQLDTICIYHTNKQELVSMECGCTTTHTILKINHSRHWIDSISIVADSLTRKERVNIQIWAWDYK